MLFRSLHLTDEIGTVSSEQFFIEVFLGIDSKAVQSSDSFSTLNQALIEVQNIKQDEVERVANEEQRTIAEQERIENEQARATAETERVTAESARVSAEEERAEGYPLLDGRLTTVEENIDLLSQKVVAGQHTVKTTTAQSYVEIFINYPDGHTHTNTTVTVSPVTLAGSQAVALYQVAMYASQVRLRFRAFDGSTIPAGTDMTIQYQFVRIDSGD